MEQKNKRTDLMMVLPQNIIVVEGFNKRIDYGDIEGLAQSILMNGLQLPLRAKKVLNQDTYELVDGHRRMRAIQLLIDRGHDIGRIPVIPFKGNQDDRLFTMFITGVDSKPLNTIEQSECVRMLINAGFNNEEISTRVGKSVSHINNLEKLSYVPKAVKALVADGKVSSNVVLSIIAKYDDETEIIEKTKEAITNAEKEGKTKATTKHVSDNLVKQPTNNQAVKLIFNTINSVENKNEKMEWFLEVLEVAKNTKDSNELLVLFEQK